MNSKEQILKMLEGRLETMQNLAIESIELIYSTAYNEGIEQAALAAESQEYGHEGAFEIRKLKK